MWISNYAIKKPIITTVVMVALVVFGAIALMRLKTDEFPEVTAPVVNIAIVYPGASPGVVERELIDPLEESFRSISGVVKIRRELTALGGVASVDVVGGVDRELTVEVKPDALRAKGVSIGQVVQTLQAENLAVPVGKLSGKLEDRTIRLRGRLSSPSEFEQLVVGRSGDRVVRLGDVAKVVDGEEEPTTAAFYNQTLAVG